MKKVIQINILNETGSTGRIMQGISKSLSERGYIVYTAYGYGKSQLSNSIKIGGKFSYLLHNIGSKLFCNQGMFSWHSTNKLIKFIEKEKIDLIHLHNIHGNYLNYKILFNYINRKNIPVIWTLHDCWPFTGKCTHFDLCNCEKWKSECSKCPILSEYPKSYFIDQSKKSFNLKKDIFTSVNNITFISPSNWLKELFKESFLKNNPIFVINNGIDINLFKPSNSNLREKFKLLDKKVILGVASPWSAKKGYKDYLKLPELLDDSYKVVMIGVSKKQKNEINEKIITIEKTESVDELAKWYSVADVFVNLTYEDNFPTVNLEALACGTPIVSYNTGGSVEVINENTGLVCEQGNLLEVKECIEYICRNILNYSNCRNFVQKNFNDKIKYLEYVSLYNEILKTRSK